MPKIVKPLSSVFAFLLCISSLANAQSYSHKMPTVRLGYDTFLGLNAGAGIAFGDANTGAFQGIAIEPFIGMNGIGTDITYGLMAGGFARMDAGIGVTKGFGDNSQFIYIGPKALIGLMGLRLELRGQISNTVIGKRDVNVSAGIYLAI